MTYRVKEVFRTIQGEGFHVGKVATFVRFTACNMWSGREQDRERDAKRNEAQCPYWCDTDFVGGDTYDAEALVDRVAEVAAGHQHVVLSGGEPLLQVDRELLAQFAARGFYVQIETNGSVPLPDGIGTEVSMPWITLSPKQRRSAVKLDWSHELKLVYPAYNPIEWETWVCSYRWLQPLADADRLVDRNAAAAMAYIQSHPDPDWRLSLQTHKILRIP